MNLRLERADGFTLTELLIATVITLTVTAALLDVVDRARGSFQAQPERADMHQRLRVAVDALTRDLLMAGAGLEPPVAAPVLPYRVGARDSDIDLGVFYRSDAISVLYVPWGESIAVSHTYHLKTDLAARTFQLMHYDGASTDLPVVDHVVKLQFEYFGDSASPLDPAMLQDGPWVPDDPDAVTFDADLLTIRRVRVLLRVQAALESMRGPSSVLFAHGGTSTSPERYLPDLELRFDVAVRNMNLGR
ncbi:MAG: PilW family protein [Vicinamibacterales bacterium]